MRRRKSFKSNRYSKGRKKSFSKGRTKRIKKYGSSRGGIRL